MPSAKFVFSDSAETWNYKWCDSGFTSILWDWPVFPVFSATVSWKCVLFHVKFPHILQ